RRGKGALFVTKQLLVSDGGLRRRVHRDGFRGHEYGMSDWRSDYGFRHSTDRRALRMDHVVYDGGGAGSARRNILAAGRSGRAVGAYCAARAATCRAAGLRRVICVDVNVFGGEVGGPENARAASLAQIDRDGILALLKVCVRSSFIKVGIAASVAADR